MIKAVIIDDEAPARQSLETLLRNDFLHKVTIVASCESVDSGVAAIREHQPDIVFLDIQMPEKNGFELFKIITNPEFEVIFTTAYDQYAIKAIRCSALDYLEKPINPIELSGAIKKFHQKHGQFGIQKRLALLLENINLSNEKIQKIAIPTQNGYEFVHANQILYCKADGSYCEIVKIDNSIIVTSQNLKNIEESLPDKMFIKIHKSYIANLNYVQSYNKKDTTIVLNNGETLDVASRRKNQIVNDILQKP